MVLFSVTSRSHGGLIQWYLKVTWWYHSMLPLGYMEVSFCVTFRDLKVCCWEQWVHVTGRYSHWSAWTSLSLWGVTTGHPELIKRQGVALNSHVFRWDWNIVSVIKTGSFLWKSDPLSVNKLVFICNWFDYLIFMYCVSTLIRLHLVHSTEESPDTLYSGSCNTLLTSGSLSSCWHLCESLCWIDDTKIIIVWLL